MRFRNWNVKRTNSDLLSSGCLHKTQSTTDWLTVQMAHDSHRALQKGHLDCHRVAVVLDRSLHTWSKSGGLSSSWSHRPSHGVDSETGSTRVLCASAEHTTSTFYLSICLPVYLSVTDMVCSSSACLSSCHISLAVIQPVCPSACLSHGLSAGLENPRSPRECLPHPDSSSAAPGAVGNAHAAVAAGG